MCVNLSRGISTEYSAKETYMLNRKHTVIDDYNLYSLIILRYMCLFYRCALGQILVEMSNILFICINETLDMCN